MSSSLQPAHTASTADRAEYLKRELVAFATAGELKDEYKRQHDLFFDNVPPEDEHEAVSVLDWFLFDWQDDNGEGAIDHFLYSRPDLGEQDQELLLEWQNSLNSVFEVRAVGKKSLRIEELDTAESFQVLTDSPFKRNQFIMARLLPLGDQFVFSDLQFIMPDRESAMAWLNMRRALDNLESPEALENAQRQQCSAFCELFGCDQLTVKPSELNATLQKFQNYLLVERRDSETGLTPAETFKAEFGHDLQVPEMPSLHEPMADAGDVTILCDDFDGIVVLPDYNKFRRVFEVETPDAEVAGWRELLWTYINDPDIPIVAFERVAEEFPVRVENALRDLLGDKKFSLEHLYAVLLHYKQPVDGLDDLDDDRQLWDLFNGNAPENNKPAKSASRANKKPAASRKQATVKKRKPAASSAKKTPAAASKMRKSAPAKRVGAASKQSKAKSALSTKRSTRAGVSALTKRAGGRKPTQRVSPAKRAKTRKR